MSCYCNKEIGFKCNDCLNLKRWKKLKPKEKMILLTEKKLLESHIITDETVDRYKRIATEMIDKNIWDIEIPN